ncbi:MAG: sigma-70 family RNA polymerase sigma factor [Acidobacteriales bacterium]|nr:sigma-70 family RNA polymerase sigma factor [Terriglobales bacterium]
MSIGLGSPPGKAVSAEHEFHLIRRILAGEKHLFYELIRPYERAVYLAAYSIVRHEADAEDVSQESFLKAFRSLAAFRGEAKFSTWLIHIAMNEARMRLRKERKNLYQSIDAETSDAADYAPLMLSDWRELPSDAVEREEVRREFERALNLLPEHYREVLVLRDVQQLSIAETAAALRTSVGNVKIRLLRARLRMRDILAPRLLSAKPSRSPFGKGRNPWS